MSAPSAGGDPSGSAPSSGRAPGTPLSRRPAYVLGLGVLWLLVIAIASPWPTAVHGDGYYTYLWARSIVFDGDIDFEEDYVTCADPWGFQHQPHGDAWNQWNPGPSIFWIPILVWDRVTNHPVFEEGSARARAGCEGPLPDRAVRGTIVAGILTLLLSYLVARRHFGEGPSLIGAFVVVFMSPLAYHAAMLLSYGHTASACTSGFVVWLWDRERTRLSPSRRSAWSWPLLGAAIGVAMLVRPQNAILAILPLFTWYAEARGMAARREGRRLGLFVLLGVAFVLGAVLFFSPQLWFWYSNTGELFLVPQSEHYVRWEAPRIMQTLFSSQAGLLTWSPMLYTSFLGLGWASIRKETRPFALPLLCFVLAHTYVSACVMDWWGGMAYPGRRFDSTVVPMAVGTAFFANVILEASRRSATYLPRLVAVSVVVLGGLWTTGATAYIQAGPGDAHDPGRSDRLLGAAGSALVSPIWTVIGDPLALPASIPFAIRYGLRPRAWDVAGAPDLFLHHWLTLERSGWNWRYDFVDTHAELLVGFEDTVAPIGGRRVRAMSGEYARAVIPVGWPDLGGFQFDVAVPPDDLDGVNLWVEIDGESLGSQWIEPGASRVRFLTSNLEAHEGLCVLRLRVVGGRIGFAGADLLDPDPSPAELQTIRNRAALERRRAWRAAWRGDAPTEP